MTQVLPKERAREYESIFIIHPDSQSNVVDTVAAKCQEIIRDRNGKLLRAENWGRRKLAYPVKKNAKGIYIYLRYLGYSDLVHELERNFRTMDPVIKFITVKIEVDVNPESRPVSPSDISFVSTFEETEAREAKVQNKVEADDTEDTNKSEVEESVSEKEADDSSDSETDDESALDDKE
ncbi:MAG: 30S ribosomal protein S6 [Deltaproteobacteria bacterium]|nr:30S ribosomal protein S6 [Deltaproteobacteria bacterium]